MNFTRQRDVFRRWMKKDERCALRKCIARLSSTGAHLCNKFSFGFSLPFLLWVQRVFSLRYLIISKTIVRESRRIGGIGGHSSYNVFKRSYVGAVKYSCFILSMRDVSNWRGVKMWEIMEQRVSTYKLVYGQHGDDIRHEKYKKNLCFARTLFSNYQHLYRACTS